MSSSAVEKHDWVGYRLFSSRNSKVNPEDLSGFVNIVRYSG